MKLIDIVNSPWAILPGVLEEIRDIYVTHLRGEKIDLAGVEARLGRSMENAPPSYDVIDGVAVIGLDGVMAQRANMLQKVSGMQSTQQVAAELRRAAADKSAHSIVFAINSPGGTVFGTQDLAGEVRRAAGIKPLVAWSDGMVASAAYWAGSAASEVFVSGDLVNVGSIGVVGTHVDVSKRNADNGVTVTEIVAGKYKRIAGTNAPLSESGQAYLQAQVDYMYSIFVDAVAAQRGVSVEQVLSDMADGRVFIGRQAVRAGLVDGVATLDQLIAELAAGTIGRRHLAAGAAVTGGPRAAAVEPIQGDQSMTPEELRKQYPDAVAQIEADAAAGELARVLAVEAAALPGHGELIDRLRRDGKTTGAQAAAQVVAAERTARGAAMEDIRADAPSPAPAASTEAGAGTESQESLVARAEAYAREHGCDLVAAYKALGVK